MRLVGRHAVQVELGLHRPVAAAQLRRGCRCRGRGAGTSARASSSWPMSHVCGAGSAPYFDASSASRSSAMRWRGTGAGRGRAIGGRAIARRQPRHVGERLREVDVAVGVLARRRARASATWRGGCARRRRRSFAVGRGASRSRAARRRRAAQVGSLAMRRAASFRSASLAIATPSSGVALRGTPRRRAPPCSRCPPT